jgi:hypothetical protein
MGTYLQRNLRAFGELNDEVVTPHPYIVHESILNGTYMINHHP